MMHFDGSSSLGGLNLAGLVTDTDQVLIHFWFDPTNPDSSNQYIAANASQYLIVRIGTNNRLYLRVEDTAAAEVAVISPVQVFTNLTGWTAVDFVVDATQGFAKVYIDGVFAAEDAALTGNGTINHDLNQYHLGARTGSSDAYTGGLAQFGYWTSFSADYVSSTGELTAKYFASVYDLDENGDIYYKDASLASALGVQPIILNENPFSTFEVNNGSQADFPTITGTKKPLQSGRELPIGGWTYTAP